MLPCLPAPAALQADKHVGATTQSVSESPNTVRRAASVQIETRNAAHVLTVVPASESTARCVPPCRWRTPGRRKSPQPSTKNKIYAPTEAATLIRPAIYHAATSEL